jgi:hypothetical protein
MAESKSCRNHCNSLQAQERSYDLYRHGVEFLTNVLATDPNTQSRLNENLGRLNEILGRLKKALIIYIDVA